MFGANEQTSLYAKGYTFHIAYGAPFIIWSAAASFVGCLMEKNQKTD